MDSEAGFAKRVRLMSLQKADLSVCDGASSFLQSGFWGAFKARFGWKAMAFRTEWSCTLPQSSVTETGPLLVLCRPLGAGLSIAYVPWGPELPSVPGEERWAALRELTLSLKQQLPRNTVFIRFDPPWRVDGPDASSSRPPFTRSGADIQPPDTVLIDLNQTMESLLAQMKPKWRYNARLALKKGVTVRRAGVEEIQVFYDLLKETAKRDGIAIHGIDYYRTLLEAGNSLLPTPHSLLPTPYSPAKINLYVAEHEGDVLAAIVTLFRGREAVYLYGASSDRKRGFMAPYALQVKAMEDAMALGCEVYDLFGIPPGEDPSHPMAGLYRFKTGFGGRIVHRPGSWDFPCRPVIYRLFRGAETLRKKLRTLKKKNRRTSPAE